MAKRFFYVCAGLLMLAVAYHLGARNAQAQAAATIVDTTGTPGGYSYAVDSTGRLYEYGRVAPARWVYVTQLPVSGTPVALGVPLQAGFNISAMMPNGDTYDWSDDTPPSGFWEYRGNVFDGTVSAQLETWSGVKGKLR